MKQDKTNHENPDLCMTCKVYQDCPFLDYEWVENLMDYIAESELSIKPNVTLSVTTCDKYISPPKTQNKT